MDFSAGMRRIQTFRKLPTTAPKMKEMIKTMADKYRKSRQMSNAKVFCSLVCP